MDLSTEKSGYAVERNKIVWKKGTPERIYRKLKKLPRTAQFSKGYDYALDYSRCESCPGTCCNIKGGGCVWITDEEILQVSQFLGHSPELIQKKQGWSLLVHPKKGCHYLKNGKCSIYPVRPSQCRNFPFWSHLKTKDIRHCPGIVKI